MLALLARIAGRAVAAEVRNSVPTGPAVLAGHTLQPELYHRVSADMEEHNNGGKF